MITAASTTSDMAPTTWDAINFTKGKPNPLAFARTVVTRNTAAQRLSRVPVTSPPATTKPVTIPTRLSTVWMRVNVAMLKPRIMGVPLRGKAPNVRGVTQCARRDSNPPTGNCTLRRLPTPGPVIYDLGDRLPRRYAAGAPHHHLGECPNEPQGCHTQRAVDRGGDHRHLGRHRDPEVRQHQGEGVCRLDEVGSSESGDRRGGLFRRLGEVQQHHVVYHAADGGYGQLLRHDRQHPGHRRPRSEEHT